MNPKQTSRIRIAEIVLALLLPVVAAVWTYRIVVKSCLNKTMGSEECWSVSHPWFKHDFLELLPFVLGLCMLVYVPIFLGLETLRWWLGRTREP